MPLRRGQNYWPKPTKTATTIIRQSLHGIFLTQTAVVHLNFYKVQKNPFEHQAERTSEAYLEEVLGLAEAIDLDVVFSRIVNIKRVNSGTLIGKGIVDDLKVVVTDLKIGLLIVNGTLSSIQQRNLEKELKCNVIDRTGLILDIFGARARTREGKLQVELASLTHQRSRLVRAWTHLERQRGGYGFIGGPGESQIELDRRKIDERILKISRDLKDIRRTRSLHRKNRIRNQIPLVALVGYTNSGKSTLFNTLTSSDVFAEDLLFATLDPCQRKTKLKSGRDIMLSDTVGFISNLPTQLVEAFKATLEEVQLADIILHIRDIAHEDSVQQADDVEKILNDLGIDMADENPPLVIEVCNKIDLLSGEEANVVHNRLKRLSGSVAISATKGLHLDALLEKIDSALQFGAIVKNITILASAGKILSWCYRQGSVVSETHEDEHIHLCLALPEAKWDWLKEQEGVVSLT